MKKTSVCTSNSQQHQWLDTPSEQTTPNPLSANLSMFHEINFLKHGIGKDKMGWIKKQCLSDKVWIDIAL